MEGNEATERLPEVAYYYPEPFWAAAEADWIKTLLLFFDQVAILLPAYMYGRHLSGEFAIAQPMEEQGLLKILQPENVIDQQMAERLGEALIDVIAAGAFDDLPKESRFAALSMSRLGYAQTRDISEMIVDELESRGLAAKSEDGLSIPLHPLT